MDTFRLAAVESSEDEKKTTFDLTKLVVDGLESGAKGLALKGTKWILGFALHDLFGVPRKGDTEEQILEAIEQVLDELDSIQLTLDAVAAAMADMKSNIANSFSQEVLSGLHNEYQAAVDPIETVLRKYTNIFKKYRDGASDFDQAKRDADELVQEIENKYDLDEVCTKILNLFRYDPHTVASEKTSGNYIESYADGFILNLTGELSSLSLSEDHDQDSANAQAYAAAIANLSSYVQNLFELFWEAHTMIFVAQVLIVNAKYYDSEDEDLSLAAYDLKQLAPDFFQPMLDNLMTCVDRLVLSCYRPDLKGKSIYFPTNDTLNEMYGQLELVGWLVVNTADGAQPGMTFRRYTRPSLLNEDGIKPFEESSLGLSNCQNIQNPEIYRGDGAALMPFWYKVVDIIDGENLAGWDDSDVQILRDHWDWPEGKLDPSVDIPGYGGALQAPRWFDKHTLRPVDDITGQPVDEQGNYVDIVLFAYGFNAGGIVNHSDLSKISEGWSADGGEFLGFEDQLRENGTSDGDYKTSITVVNTDIFTSHLASAPQSAKSKLQWIGAYYGPDQTASTYLVRNVTYKGSSAVTCAEGDRRCYLRMDTNYTEHISEEQATEGKFHGKFCFDFAADEYSQPLYNREFKVGTKYDDHELDLFSKSNREYENPYLDREKESILVPLRENSFVNFTWETKLTALNCELPSSQYAFVATLRFEWDIYYARLAWMPPALKWFGRVDTYGCT